MVKKQQKTAARKQGRAGDTPRAGPSPADQNDSPFARQVKDSAQQIWSAGLAAFAKAQGEGGKVVDTLVDEAPALSRKTKTQATTKAKAKAKAHRAPARSDEAAHRISDMAGEVGNRAGQHWDKLESIFEDRVARALARLGVPTAQELARLSARVDALTEAVAALRQASRSDVAASDAKASAKLAKLARTSPKASGKEAVGKAPKKAAKKNDKTPMTKTARTRVRAA